MLGMSNKVRHIYTIKKCFKVKLKIIVRGRLRLMITRTMEDYLEVIWNLQEKKGYVKAKDIAESLKISRPSVSEMIKRLSENEYIAVSYTHLTLPTICSV